MSPIILGVDLWIMDEGVAYPPLVTNGDSCSPDFGKPMPGMATNLSSILKAGTPIYTKHPECRCQCPEKSQDRGNQKEQKKRSFGASGRTVRSQK